MSQAIPVCAGIRRVAAALMLAALAAAPAGAQSSIETSAGPMTITPVVTGLNQPWAVGFLPGGGFLVTERAGRLWHFDGQGGQTAVAGLPVSAVAGQGGLLDVMIPRDFAESRQVFLSFSIPQGGGAGTALGVGRLSGDGSALEGFEVLFQSAEGFSGGRHFGSRIVEGADGTIFLTIGDRGSDRSAQDLSNHNGSVIRINRDGSVPDDNPYVAQADARPEVWSHGHRNPQGAALDLGGQLWVSEHGARGGDEINRVGPGLNYGWPVISYGMHYSGRQIGVGTAASGMEQPAHYWDPSPAPSGHMVYSGALVPAWRGHHFIGSLQFDQIMRLDPDDGWAQEAITGPETRRIRDVREAPDGTIWFLSVGEGALFRMAPAEAG